MAVGQLPECSRSGSPGVTASPRRRDQPATIRPYIQPDRPRLDRGSGSSDASRPSKFREGIASTPSDSRPVKKKRSLFRLPKINRRKKTANSKQKRSHRRPWHHSIPPFDGAAEFSFSTKDRDSSLPVPCADPTRSSTSSTSSRMPQRHSVAITVDDAGPSGASDQATGTQSLEDYEKGLSAQGDSRHRKSTVNFNSIRDIEQDDRNDSDAQNRPLSRASPLYGPNAKSGEQILMEKALKFHQAEKGAFFRFKGKDKASPELSPADPETTSNGPVFHVSFGPASSPSRIFSGLDDVDPLAEEGVKRARSTIPLYNSAVRRTPTPLPLSDQKIVNRNGASVSTSSNSFNGPVPLGIPPASWARFASDTRAARTSPAGQHDNVKIHDFAEDMRCYMPDPDHMVHKHKHSGLWERIGLSSRPNDTKVGRIVRYYKNLLAGVGGGGNRRSSVATGARLKDPELEILGPVMAGRDTALSGGDKTVEQRGKKRRRDRDSEEGKHAQMTVMSGAGVPNQAPTPHNHDAEHKIIVDSPRATSAKTPEDVFPTEMTAKVPNGPALTLDGAVDAAISRIKENSLTPRSSARCLSELYQRECVTLPPTSGHISHISEEAFQDAREAARVPLPETPTRFGRLAGASWGKVRGLRSSRSMPDDSTKSRGKDSPVSPIRIGRTAGGGHLQKGVKSLLFLPEVDDRGRAVSPVANKATDLANHHDEVEAGSGSSYSTAGAEEGGDTTRTQAEPAPTESGPAKMDAMANTEVTIRRFPSVTVVDDRKGQWRSISLISTIHSRSGSGSSSVHRPASKVRNVTPSSDHYPASKGRIVSGASRYDTVRTRPGSRTGSVVSSIQGRERVRPSTVDLLRDVEERKERELARLMGRIGSGGSVGVAV
ncbi:hypothetical protein BDZ85DRAFT_281322 [Elsinoe ampelina]|uniref:Uncharacterized protein n=1 Tax=Elsinoe ampelina TaxID=302913 RepID=A0A6A6GCW8_9PEZI|nr:hypothetical protein BDZ85DRAFT_281322 [Elsinoe ampelina]